MAAGRSPATRTSDPTCPPRVPEPIESDLGWALGALFRAYLRTVVAVVADVPGGPRGYQVLAAAADLPETQLALAQRLGIDRTVLTYLLDDLERAGLVRREPDPADRRARRIVPTDRGGALAERLRERLWRAEEQVLGALDEDDRATFRALLERVASRAQAVHPAAGLGETVQEINEASGLPSAGTCGDGR